MSSVSDLRQMSLWALFVFFLRLILTSTVAYLVAFIIVFGVLLSLWLLLYAIALILGVLALGFGLVLAAVFG